MKIFSFDRNASKQMISYESSSVSYSHIAQISYSGTIGCMYIQPNGVVGIHEAPCPQLFLVVQGEGWVSGKTESEKKIPLKAGQGVFWARGEMHESGSDSGMTAIVVQCNEFDPNTLF